MYYDLIAMIFGVLGTVLLASKRAIKRKAIRKRAKNQVNQMVNLPVKNRVLAKGRVLVKALILMTLEQRKKTAKNVLAKGNVLANLRDQQSQIHSLRKNN